MVQEPLSKQIHFTKNVLKQNINLILTDLNCIEIKLII